MTTAKDAHRDAAADSLSGVPRGALRWVGPSSRAAPPARRVPNRLFPLAFLALALLVNGRSAGAAAVTVRAAVERQQVFAGEPFLFQIQVAGSENPSEPDLSGLSDFSVEVLGGQRNSSQSVTIINGRMQKQVSMGYVFNYRLTAKRAGRLTIPSLALTADGQAVRTQPIGIDAQAPAETDTVKLRLSLSRETAYVGEPVTLTVTWYIGQNVRNFQFNVPILTHPDFTVGDLPPPTDPRQEYVRIPLAGGETVGVKGQGVLDGKGYATVQFRKVLIPRVPGSMSIEPAVVACEVLTGYRQSRSPFGGSSLMDRFFNDDFFGGSRGVYAKVVAPSNPLTLEVRPLPVEGRPSNFNGLVGRYRFEASATPLEVNVGDPITLTLSVSGPDYLEAIELPPLASQPDLARDFKIPGEMAEGKVQGERKLFTQTIRALRSDITAVPPLELPYFDSARGEYAVARTESIPLIVREARIVTAADAEGLDPTAPSGAAVEAWARGIAHNYEGSGVLTDQRFGPTAWLRSPPWIACLAAPPLAFGLLLVVNLTAERRRANPERVRARKAFREFERRLRPASFQSAKDPHPVVLEAMRLYLGDKLGLPARALTYKDVREPLAQRGADEVLLGELRGLFEKCEAGRYAGRVDAVNPDALAGEAVTTVRKLEEVCR